MILIDDFGLGKGSVHFWERPKAKFWDCENLFRLQGPFWGSNLFGLQYNQIHLFIVCPCKKIIHVTYSCQDCTYLRTQYEFYGFGLVLNGPVKIGYHPQIQYKFYGFRLVLNGSDPKSIYMKKMGHGSIRITHTRSA